MNEKLHVLIIEDDFRVADINRQLVEQVDGYVVDAALKSGDEAMAYLADSGRLPDLIVMDVFIPDRTGLELLWEIRKDFYGIGIIMLTAAKESATVGQALRGGIFDYIVKPADFGRFEEALVRFREQKAMLASREELDQADIDRLVGVQPASSAARNAEEPLPKGIDQLTLAGIVETLRAAAPAGINAMQAGKAVGVSRSTARRYLEHLVAAGEAKAQLHYGEIGRPERQYILWTK